MMVANKNDLITAIDRSAEELHQRVDMHRCLMKTILQQRVGEGTLRRLSSSFSSPGEARFKAAIGETIEVLEQTRKAFKSKRLEALRKRLIHVLIESK
ncbi:MAG: hypothetical protein JRJ09_17020 [Deltaproteobacteria bacterium]|nr:hypothetical protein [Deltaproteobacteria bacterium]MBW2050211.1 hypothetical protein [Deltaproteobacteria bacterium]MBW2112954.1 hypothetical protein [Deltaproteobacteria bacterium]MBW2354786.1 hypothetical protein [Deltaproteobacteria bacterium]HDZ23991.1 hypothetical protein [Desulfobacteraceae bacterium]